MSSLWSSVREADRRDVAIGALIFCAAIAAVTALTFASGTAKDLDVYLLAARRFADGGSVYGSHFGRSLTEPLPYTYPPVLAAVLSLVAWLPMHWVTIAWTVLDLVLLVGIVRISYARALARAGRRWPIALAALVGLFALTAPVLSVFDLGQIGLVLLVLVLADTLPERTRLPRGVLVGAATAVKLVPGLFIAYWAATKRWRAAAFASGSAVALWIGAALLRPDLSHTYWLGILFDPARAGDAGDVVNQSTQGLVTRIGWSGPAVWTAIATAAIAVGLVRARRAHLAGDELAAVSLIGLATLLASPISWIHHAVWIVPVTGVLFGDGSSRRRVLTWAFTVTLFLSGAPLLGHTGVTLVAPLAFLVHNAFVLAYWALLLCLPIHANGRTADPRTGTFVLTSTPVAAHR